MMERSPRATSFEDHWQMDDLGKGIRHEEFKERRTPGRSEFYSDQGRPTRDVVVVESRELKGNDLGERKAALQEF